MSDERSAGRAWFRPKDFGYGATPITWKGWLATLLFVLVILATTALGDPRGAASPRSVHILLSLKGLLGLTDVRLGIAPMLSIIAAESVAFVAFARWKSSGPWRWRG
ncbi:MAG: hypothetical protein JWP86_3102 [Phenylobacterium sp.]|nr:hypothetical protein [Phenylobacterium sp.]MDB5495765.1 hypothetical protein [Phenylobacterium sp.]